MSSGSSVREGALSYWGLGFLVNTCQQGERRERRGVIVRMWLAQSRRGVGMEGVVDERGGRRRGQRKGREGRGAIPLASL